MILQYHRRALKLAVTCSRRQIVARGMATANSVVSGLAMKAFDITRPLVSAAAVGLAQRALEEATKYAQERHTMGQPIINHQGVAFMLADMAIGVEAARGLVWKAAWAKDCMQRNRTSQIQKLIVSKHLPSLYPAA
ncbi:hypothetical protein I308_105056 [Cryptococcus tetragattii IND107]|uniref:Acyl-CoA dehydrogenase/oxidase C-terminal domain-containing protein n=1 Tax=Cryptococcus tetragattii IND107 TaxID=1296105 RepID=A0ABR3BLX1_9TREE